MQVIRRAATAPKRNLYTIEPEEYDHKVIKTRIAICDTETDPFREGRVVKPFTCGYYLTDSEEYFDFWGDDCIDQMFAHMVANFGEDKITFFWHNGGNFDAYFCTEYFDAGMEPFIINGRLVKITCKGFDFRDSYAMIPVALGSTLTAEDGGKIEFNYAKMESVYSVGEATHIDANAKGVETYNNLAAYQEYLSLGGDPNATSYSPREFFRVEILKYQKQDCTALGKLVVEWLDMFGNKLTMASVALPMLRSFHGFDTMSENTDNELRPYYFGGRCQAFELGVIRGEFYGYDINSSYPDVMRRYMHPISSVPTYDKKITNRTHFARIRAYSNGALPVRMDNGSLDFPIGTRDFYACIHEINAGLETGLLRIHHVYETMHFDAESNFADFIDTFYAKRLEAGENGDEIRKLFYKLVMNSSYGKFAQDPRKYESWVFDPDDIPSPLLCEGCHAVAVAKGEKVACTNCEKGTHDAYGWYLHTLRDGKHIYARPQKLRAGTGFFNVATAASITSAARASLLLGINAATRPIYCDTDSLICEALDAELDDKKLGAWKLEFEADEVAIAGKKMYAVFRDGKEIKKASKGVRLSGDQIRRIAKGETIEYANPVPKFKLNGDVDFVTRRIKATGKTVNDETITKTKAFSI
jgi:hypothetical protein